MQELEKRLDELELKLLTEITEVTKDTTDIWDSISKLVDMMKGMTKEIGSLRIDVNKLIENSCGCKKSAQDKAWFTPRFFI